MIWYYSIGNIAIVATPLHTYELIIGCPLPMVLAAIPSLEIKALALIFN